MKLTLGKAAKKAGVSKPTMSSWLKSGKVSGQKNEAGIYEIDSSDLERFLAFRNAESANVNPNSKPTSKQSSEAVDVDPATLTLENANSMMEVRYAAALEIVRAERDRLLQDIQKSDAQRETAERRAEEWEERYVQATERLTGLLEDRRPKQTQQVGLLQRLTEAFRKT